MRCVPALLSVALLLVATPASGASTSAPRLNELTSRDAVLGWVWAYRSKPNPEGVPAALKAASRLGLLRDPEASGVFVGFLAGVIGANPAKAESLLTKTLPLPVEDQWMMVRAIAYSGLPEWKSLLRRVGPRLPARRAMVEKQLAGRLPTLDQLHIKDDPKWYEQAWETVRIDKYFTKKDKADKPVRLEPSGDLIDAYWGYYFATGAYSPIARIVALTRWAKHRDDVEKLSIGSMAKYTLATNATRDPAILSMLQWATKQEQPKEVKEALAEIVEAAETAETARIRKEAYGAVEELRRKGPGSRRDVATWGRVGEGAISLGCLGAAVTGQVQFGLPCVVGGALTSAALRYWATPD
jgi:hypothetical protein